MLRIITIVIFFIPNWGYSQECIIYPGQGISQINLKESTLEDAIRIYGKHEIQEKEVFGCGYFGDESCGKGKHIRYHDHDIDFMCKPRAKTTQINVISVFGKSACKTEKGIQVKKSTINDIVAAYGAPVSTAKNEHGIYLYYHGITYICESGDKKVEGIAEEGDKELKSLIIKKK